MPLPDALKEELERANAERRAELEKRLMRKAAREKENRAPKPVEGTRAITSMFGKMTELSEDYRRSPKKSPSKGTHNRNQ